MSILFDMQAQPRATLVFEMVYAARNAAQGTGAWESVGLIEFLRVNSVNSVSPC